MRTSPDRFLAAATDVTDDRIAVVGMSMGGEEAIGAAASAPSSSHVEESSRDGQHDTRGAAVVARGPTACRHGDGGGVRQRARARHRIRACVHHGSGSIFYRADPDTVDESVTGSGSTLAE